MTDTTTEQLAPAAAAVVDEVKAAVTELGNTALKIVRHRQVAEQAAAAIPELTVMFADQLDAIRAAVLPAPTRTAGRQPAGAVSGSIVRWLAANPSGGQVATIAAGTGLSNSQVSGTLHSLKTRGEVWRSAGGIWRAAA